jgi:multicomponent Na+:H+ antiporter subunit G
VTWLVSVGVLPSWLTMSGVVSLVSAVLLVAGAFFFLAGTVGLLRFPDVYSRLHALTKADALGLGFLAAGLALRSGSASTAVKLGVIWTLVLVASATSAYVVAQRALQRERGTRS